jgi:hypothetical protein
MALTEMFKKLADGVPEAQVIISQIVPFFVDQEKSLEGLCQKLLDQDLKGHALVQALAPSNNIATFLQAQLG